MNNLDDFRVELQSTRSGVHLPGQLVRGTVFITNIKEFHFYELLVRAEGCASVSWTKSFGRRYHASELYLNLKIPLISPEGDDRIQLAPGRHKFPFAFTLSRRIPPSFEGACGSVRYSVVAVVRCSKDEPDDDAVREIPFVVNVHSGHNIVTTYQSEELCGSVCKFVKTWSSAGFILAELYLDRTWASPGETIYLNAKIWNYKYSRSFPKAVVKLIQYTTFTDGKRHHHKTKQILWKNQTGAITDKGVQCWDRVPIAVPKTTPSGGLSFCCLFEISYVIKLTVDPGWFSSNVTLPVKIIIRSTALDILNFCDTL